MSGSVDVVGSRSKYATTIHLCVGSILSSVGIMFLNKQLMTEIHSPSYLSMVTFCTMWHQITAATFTKLSTVLGLQSTPPEEENVRPRVVIALAMGGSILFNNWALALLPVGTCQLFKLLCIPCIAIIQFIFHGQRVPLNVCGSLALLLIGVGIATVEHLSLQFLPASIALCGVLLTAISQTMVQSYNKKNVPLQSMHLLQVTSPYVASFMAICFVILENVYPSGILDASTWNTGYALPVLVLSCIVSIATNFYGYSLIQTCSAVTFQVIGNLKTITVLMASFVCADLVPSGKSVFGIVIALIGSGFYSMIQVNRSNNIERLPTDIIQIQRSCPITEKLSIQQRCRALFSTVRPRQVLTVTVSAFIVLLLLYFHPWDASSKYGSDKQFAPDNGDEQLKGSLNVIRDTIDSGDIDMIDPNDRDALVVNGCFVDPLTKANNWTDLTAPIMLANECQVQVSKRCPTPNVYHGVWLGGHFKLHHAMSFKSIYTRMRPFAFYIHGYDFPVGDAMWDHAVRTYNIILVPTRHIEKVFGIPIIHVEHMSDVIRLETVLRFGGVYTDTDVWVLKDLSALLARNIPIMDREGLVGICNSFIGTPRCSTFVKMWYSKYQSFQNTCWVCDSVKLPHLLNMEFPGNLYVTGDQPTPTYINSPEFYTSGHYLYGEGIWDFTKNWAVHTWWRRWQQEPTMSEWENGTFANGMAIPVGISRLARNILFDHQL